MIETKYYISEILEDTCDIIKRVSVHVYPEHRPTATPKQMKDLVVVSIPSSISDKHVCQKSIIRIELIARNLSTGVAYTKRLQEMLNTLVELFPIVRKRFSITSPYLALKGDDGLGFTVWNVQAKLIVNTTDSYKY